MDGLDGGADAGAGAALRAGLDDELGEVLGGGDELLAFEDVMRKGLLDVEVLAGLEGPDALDRVLVVGRGDRDGVDFLVLEHLPHVGVAFGARVVLQALGDDARVDVAKRDDPHAFDALEFLDVFHAAAAEADDGDAEVAVGAGRLRVETSAEAGGRDGHGRGLEEGATMELGHDGN